jgi:hypothetical protein
MNIEVAKQLVELLKTQQEQDGFNMGYWFGDGNCDINPKGIVRDDLQPENLCFTTACAAGWLCTLYPEKAKELSKDRHDWNTNNFMVTIGSDLLEISESDGWELFFWSDVTRGDVSPETAVIKILEEMIVHPENNLSDLIKTYKAFEEDWDDDCDDYDDYDDYEYDEEE